MINENRGSVFTLAVVTGTSEEEVKNQVEQYFKEYIPAGYSTRIVKPPANLGGDLWEARVSRYSSCD